MKAVAIVCLLVVNAALTVSACRLAFSTMQKSGWDREMQRIQDEQQASFEGRGNV